MDNTRCTEKREAAGPVFAASNKSFLDGVDRLAFAVSGNGVQLKLSGGGRTRINESRCFGFHGDMLYPDDEIAGGSVLARMN